MSDNNRKATDVLLSIENKLEELLNHHRSQDLNLKILSNKLNNFLDLVPKMMQPVKEAQPQQPPKFTVEIADSAPVPIKVAPSIKIEQDSDPVGFRRTSRPETFENKFQKQQDVEFTEYESPKVEKTKPANVKIEDLSSVQVTQRVIDKKQKSIFLAEVEVKTLDGEIAHKTRTNSVGKWSASLKPGKYRVSVSKKESSLKQKVDLFQDIELKSDRSTIILQDLIVT